MEQLSLFDKVVSQLPERFEQLESFMLDDTEFRVCVDRNIFEELIKKEIHEPVIVCKSKTVLGKVLGIWATYSDGSDNFVVHIPSKTIVYESCSFESAFQLVQWLNLLLPRFLANKNIIKTKTSKKTTIGSYTQFQANEARSYILCVWIKYTGRNRIYIG